MIEVVVDASVTAAWCFDDEQTEYARSILKRANDISFRVPAIWPIEMLNVLLVNERKKRISPTDTARAIHLFNELAIQVDRVGSLRLFDTVLLLARAHGLTSYDASYID